LKKDGEKNVAKERQKHVKQMKKSEIAQAWEDAEDIFPDKSTEFLLQYVADMTNSDYGTVAHVVATECFEEE